MKAMRLHKIGDFKYEDVELRDIKDDEILMKVPTFREYLNLELIHFRLRSDMNSQGLSSIQQDRKIKTS